MMDLQLAGFYFHSKHVPWVFFCTESFHYLLKNKILYWSGSVLAHFILILWNCNLPFYPYLMKL